MMEKEKLVGLVTAAQGGDKAAVNELFSAFYEDFRYFALKNVHDEEIALDVTQEAFIEIFSTLGTLKEPAAFVTWAKTIIYHKSTHHFRKKSDVLVDEDEEGATLFDNIREENAEFIPDEALNNDEFKNTLMGMIDELPEEQAATIKMFYYDEMKIGEIAKLQGISENTVKSRLNYGRKSMEKTIEDYDKKNGTNLLRGVAILPLMRWLFSSDAAKQKLSEKSAAALANGVSKGSGITVSASKTAGAAPSATANGGGVIGGNESTNAAGGSIGAKVKEKAKDTAKDTAKDLAVDAIKEGAKFGAKKWLAGIVAAALFAGGVATGTALPDGKDEAPKDSNPGISAPADTDSSDSSSADEIIPGNPTGRWFGFGEHQGRAERRIDLVIDEATETTVKGSFVTSEMYQTIQMGEFEGTGTVEEDGDIYYEIEFNRPVHAYLGTADGTSFTYHKKTDELEFTNGAIFFAGFLVREGSIEERVIAQNVSFSGPGVDGFEQTSLTPEHNRLFELQVYKMSNTAISGKLTVSFDGAVSHTTEFSGRGYEDLGGNIFYEIELDSPRREAELSAEELRFMLLTYHTDTEDFETYTYDYYRATMYKN